MIKALRYLWECFFADDRPAPEAEIPAAPPRPAVPAQDDEPPPSSVPLSGLTAMPIQRTLQAEVRSRAKALTVTELRDVIRFTDAMIAARGAGPSPLVMMRMTDGDSRTTALAAYCAAAALASPELPALTQLALSLDSGWFQHLALQQLAPMEAAWHALPAGEQPKQGIALLDEAILLLQKAAGKSFLPTLE